MAAQHHAPLLVWFHCRVRLRSQLRDHEESGCVGSRSTWVGYELECCALHLLRSPCRKCRKTGEAVAQRKGGITCGAFCVLTPSSSSRLYPVLGRFDARIWLTLCMTCCQHSAGDCITMGAFGSSSLVTLKAGIPASSSMTSHMYEHLPSCFIDGNVRRERNPFGQ